ncbi:hypothetical protein GCM10010869_15580 [Mesorhizobium tianshanense]|uniref:UrcA family protein n=1 Tax=Mesorhizobium tianshanense TaxID=39844 RepID=A0A562NW92_9HYPH|nr:hypothetical protein IQ26_03005 [Mesorhizobium tianshanense]GLS35969.1 hypothetical protein GCM10010869_15580 [Mesorhizobium tianshanense]
MNRFLITIVAGICFTYSAASAGQGEQKNIDHVAGMADAKLNLAATMAGNVTAVMQRCRASLRLTEDGRAIITLPVLLYDGRDKHLTPNPPKFKRAIRVYEDAYNKAVRRTDSCQTEMAKYPRLYR